MTTDPESQPTLGQRLKTWFSNLIADPIGTLVQSAVWLFMLAIGIFILVLFARMGWDMIRGAWN